LVFGDRGLNYRKLQFRKLNLKAKRSLNINWKKEILGPVDNPELKIIL